MMSVQHDWSGYCRRLFWSCAVVGTSCLATLFFVSLDQALVGMWFLPGLFLDHLTPKWSGGMGDWSLALFCSCLTAAVLAVCAKSRFAPVVGVTWFLLNLLTMLSVVVVYDGHS